MPDIFSQKSESSSPEVLTHGGQGGCFLVTSLDEGRVGGGAGES